MNDKPENQFTEYVKLIGKGKRAGKYLTLEQAYDAFKLLLADEAEPEQIGAFLMLLRVREESVEELAGFVKASREFVNPELKSLAVDIDMGCYAGKRRHLPWFLLAVICMAQAGHKIFLHGCTEPGSQRMYLPQVFECLNLPIAKSANQAQELLNNIGFAYMDIANISEPLKKLLQMRSLFGLRSPANTLARMLNPCDASFSLHGVFHKHFDQKHIQVAELLNDQGVGCLRGEGGEIEVNPERPFNLYIQDKTQAIQSFPTLLQQWQIKPASLNPEELEQLWTGKLKFEYGEQAVIGTIACMLSLTKKIAPSSNVLEQAKDIWQQRNAESFNRALC